jgi:rRNA small subunit aminocarboxypropyltransferase
MRSSESTPSPSPRPAIPLLLLLAGEDHPKACTGRRLLHRGLARSVRRIASLRPPPIVLDPHAPDPLSQADRSMARRGGVLAVDCSWNRIESRGSLPGLPDDDGGIHRRLPILVAGNPQHFGRIAELNTVEALSAALYVLGQRTEAARLLDGFRGGDGFLTINRERLDFYASRRTADAVRVAERKIYGGE